MILSGHTLKRMIKNIHSASIDLNSDIIYREHQAELIVAPDRPSHRISGENRNREVLK